MAGVGEAHRLSGNEAFARGAWTEAVEEYDKAIKEGGDDKRVYSNRSAARLKLAQQFAAGNLNGAEYAEAAVLDADVVIGLDPQWAKGYFRKGLALEWLGKDDDAVAAFVEGLKISPADAEQIVGASPALRKLVEANAAGSQVPQTTTSSASVGEGDEAEKLRLEGNAAFRARDWDSAIQLYSEALNYLESDEKPKDKRIYSNRSAAYLAKAEETESSVTHQFAVDDAEVCVSLDPTWPKSWYRLGLALAGANRVDEAIEKLREGLVKCPGDPELEKTLEQVEQARQAAENPSAGMQFDENERAAETEKPRTGTAVDLTLYNTLGVKPTSTAAEIKKAYLFLAKETHPDKNKEDPSATERFQKIGEAYQILSNPETREAYDKYGMKGLENMDYENVDPSELFAMLFGSDRFEPFLGELQLTSMVSELDADGNPPSAEKLAAIHDERVKKLTQNLIGIIQTYVDGHHKEFIEWCNKEAKELKETNFGGPMLFVVGQSYVRHAYIKLGKLSWFGLPGYWRQFNNSRMKIGTKWSAIASAARVLSQQKQVEQEVQRAEKEGKTISPEEQTKMAEGVAVGYLDVVWKQTIMDIVYTLDEVCHRVLSGKDLEGSNAPSKKKGHAHGFVSNVSKQLFGSKVEPPKDGKAAVGHSEITAARAMALKKLGEIFMESGSMDIEKELNMSFGPQGQEEVH